jgi:hypothetical protein
MATLTREELDVIILQWRDEIATNEDLIRRAQDKVLLKVGPENYQYVLTVMAAILGKGGLIMSNVTNTTIGSAGVAITGGSIEGNISGEAHHNTATISSEFNSGIQKLKEAIANSPELTEDQKEDATTAVEDLEVESQKPDKERSLGRVRNACQTLTKLGGMAKGLYTAYAWVAPHLEALFHLAK